MPQNNGHIRRRSSSASEHSVAEDSPAKRAKHTHSLDLTQRAKALQRPQQPASQSDDSDRDSAVDYDDGDSDDDEALDDAAYDDETIMERFNAYKASQGKNSDKYLETAGWVKGVHLIDFMCHRNLNIDFVNKMNFITGNNGSGKSAALTALAVALGGKTSMTGRANGLKELIRGECDRAIVTVTLCNKGYNAYKPEVYGDEIIVERVLNRTGASPYKFRATKDGKILANKREELVNITSAFIVDVDQPLTILTQDLARSFLARADEEDLYKFFIKGTNLETLQIMYKAAESNIQSIANSGNAQKASLPELQERQRQMDKLLEQHGQIEQKKRRRAELEKEHAWACIREKEKEQEDLLASKHAAEAAVSKVEDDLAEAEATWDRINAQMGDFEIAIKAFAASRGDLETEKRVASAARKAASSLVQDLQTQVDENRKSIKKSKNELASLEENIKALRAKQAAGRSAEVKDAEAEAERYEGIKRGLQKSIIAGEQKADKLANDVRAAEDQAQAADDLLYQVTGARSAKADSLKNLQDTQKNALLRFGDNVDKLVAAIDRESWVGRKPVGPMGRYVSLVENSPPMQSLFSSVLGGLMCGFAVQDDRDRSKLQRMIRQHVGQHGYRTPFGGSPPMPMVIQNSGDMFDFSSGYLQYLETGELKTMLTMLRFEDEWVKRIFIVSTNIERSFAAINQDIAVRELSRLVNAKGHAVIYSAMPRLYRQIADKDGQQGQPQTSAPKNFFLANIEKAIQEAQGELQTLNLEVEKAHQAKRETVTKLKELKHELATTRSTLDKERRGLDRSHEKLASLQLILDHEPSVEINALIQRRQATEDALTQNEIQLQVGLESLELRKQEHAKADIKATEATTKVENFVGDLRRQETELNMIGRQRHQADADRNIHKKNITAMQRRVQETEEKMALATTELQEWLTMAMSIERTRVETDRAPAVVLAERERLKKEIANAEKKQGVNTDQIFAENVSLKAKIREIKESVRNTDRITTQLTKSLIQRQRVWQDMRAHAAILTRCSFLANMGKRNMEGRVAFDHTGQKLIMGVQSSGPTQEGGHSQYKSAKLLSGGERSYATVSLLLALWESTSGPMRCLDEWDVFLDGVNRGLAAKILIEGAKASEGKQYILITPQSMKGIKLDGPDTKVIRMPDPIRNQGTINFGPSAS